MCFFLKKWTGKQLCEDMGAVRNKDKSRQKERWTKSQNMCMCVCVFMCVFWNDLEISCYALAAVRPDSRSAARLPLSLKSDTRARAHVTSAKNRNI